MQQCLDKINFPIKPCPNGYCKFIGGTDGTIRPGECVEGVPSLTDCPNGLVGATSNFVCFNEGHVPDPTDCRKYYYCSIDASSAPSKLVAKQFSCAPGMMYNKIAKKCNIAYSQAYCTTADCSGSNYNLRLLYSHSNQFWTQCVPPKVSGESPTVLAGACPDGFEVDLKSFILPPKCTYKCTGLGYFPNSVDNKKYIQCYASGWAYKAQELMCESGWTFKTSAWGPWFAGCVQS